MGFVVFLLGLFIQLTIGVRVFAVENAIAPQLEVPWHSPDVARIFSAPAASAAPAGVADRFPLAPSLTVDADAPSLTTSVGPILVGARGGLQSPSSHRTATFEQTFALLSLNEQQDHNNLTLPGWSSTAVVTATPQDQSRPSSDTLKNLLSTPLSTMQRLNSFESVPLGTPPASPSAW